MEQLQRDSEPRHSQTHSSQGRSTVESYHDDSENSHELDVRCHDSLAHMVVYDPVYAQPRARSKDRDRAKPRCEVNGRQNVGSFWDRWAAFDATAGRHVHIPFPPLLFQLPMFERSLGISLCQCCARAEVLLFNSQ